jgi:hypothetical protein
VSDASGELRSPFLLVFAREGQEEFVKNEFGIRFLGAKFSFSRPGFLSFKQSEALTGLAAEWRAAQAENLVFPLRTAFFVGKWIAGKGFAAIGGFDFASAGFRHVHGIDAFTKKNPKDEGATRVMGADDFRARFPGSLDGLAKTAAWGGEWNTCAGAGERILNVIAVSEKEVWFGLTDLRDADFGWPGGESRIERAADSPSRASVKIEEAIALLERKAGGPVLKAGERAIEVGAAPGGAVHALLARGLKVTGVDRAEMAPVVREHPGFTWIDSSIGDWMFPESTEVEWLALDMNAEPRIALRETKPLVDYVKRGLKGVFFTLKLNQVDFALNAERLGKTLAKDLNLTTWFLKQLPANHQEVAFFGLTSRATAKVFVRS